MGYASEKLKNFLNLPGVEDALNAHDWEAIHKKLSENNYSVMPEFVRVLHALGVEKEMFNAFKFIPPNSFWRNSNITSYDIPEGIDCIYNKAFGFCENLESIKLPDSVDKIYKRVFEYDAKLKNISLPNSLTFLGDEAFFESGLESINIPSDVTMGVEVFGNCSSLKSATIDAKILNDGAFKRCKSLKTVKIGKNFKEIGAEVFLGCNNLCKIDYEGTAEEWKHIYILYEGNTKLCGLKVKCADGVTLKCSALAWYPI